MVEGGGMEGYGQYCPIALGAEVFAERWTPLIVRNLMSGAERFGDLLQGAPGLPRSVLAQRLRSLDVSAWSPGTAIARRPTG